MKRRKIFAATAAGAAAALLISACSSSSGSSGSSSNTPTTGAVAFNAGISSVVNPSTHKGGTMIYDNSSTPDSFDPGNTYYAWVLNFDRLFVMPMYTFKSCPGACGEQLTPVRFETSSEAGNERQRRERQNLRIRRRDAAQNFYLVGRR